MSVSNSSYPKYFYTVCPEKPSWFPSIFTDLTHNVNWKGTTHSSCSNYPNKWKWRVASYWFRNLISEVTINGVLRDFIKGTSKEKLWKKQEDAHWNFLIESEEGFLHRRNFVDKVEDCERGIITRIEGGGHRLFVIRENVEGIEVWESSHSSGTVSALWQLGFCAFFWGK